MTPPRGVFRYWSRGRMANFRQLLHYRTVYKTAQACLIALATWRFLPSPSSAQVSDPQVNWHRALDRFYTFEFAGSVEDFRSVVHDTRNSSTLEQRYWLSKALWVFMLDQQVDVNQDFMTAVLDKTRADVDLVPTNLKREFSAETEAGLDACRIVLKKDSKNLDAVYYEAMFRSNLAAYKLLIAGRRVGALADIRNSMASFKEVLRRDASRSQALTYLGLGHYLIGTNPWYVRMFNPFLGLDGDSTLGLKELQEAAKGGNTDARFILKAALIREGRMVEALALVKDLSQEYPRNFSFSVQIAQLTAMLGRKDEAKILFEDLLKRLAADRTIDQRYTPAKIREVARKAGVIL